MRYFFPLFAVVTLGLVGAVNADNPETANTGDAAKDSAAYYGPATTSNAANSSDLAPAVTSDNTAGATDSTNTNTSTARAEQEAAQKAAEDKKKACASAPEGAGLAAACGAVAYDQETPISTMPSVPDSNMTENQILKLGAAPGVTPPVAAQQTAEGNITKTPLGADALQQDKYLQEGYAGKERNTKEMTYVPFEEAKAKNLPYGWTESTRTSDYGARDSIKTDNGHMSSSDHKGEDYSRGPGLTQGTDIYSNQTGKVVKASDTNNGYGKTVLIEDKNGNVTQYSHLSDVNVKVGDEVTTGYKIGDAGATGNASGPHLHYAEATNVTADAKIPKDAYVNPATSNIKNYDVATINSWDSNNPASVTPGKTTDNLVADTTKDNTQPTSTKTTQTTDIRTTQQQQQTVQQQQQAMVQQMLSGLMNQQAQQQAQQQMAAQQAAQQQAYAQQQQEQQQLSANGNMSIKDLGKLHGYDAIRAVSDLCGMDAPKKLTEDKLSLMVKDCQKMLRQEARAQGLTAQDKTISWE